MSLGYMTDITNTVHTAIECKSVECAVLDQVGTNNWLCNRSYE